MMDVCHRSNGHADDQLVLWMKLNRMDSNCSRRYRRAVVCSHTDAHTSHSSPDFREGLTVPDGTYADLTFVNDSVLIGIRSDCSSGDERTLPSAQMALR